MKKVVRLNLIIMYACFCLILSILVSPLLFKNQKMISLKSNEVFYSPDKSGHYASISIDIAKHPKVYTMDMNIYKIPGAPYFLFFIEIILILGIIMNDKASRKLQQASTEQSHKNDTMKSESAKSTE